jgi:hypothetical protein
MSHPPNTMSSSDASGTKSLISGAAFGALAEAYRAHLRERANRFRQTPANSENARDSGRADRPHPDEKNAEFSSGFSDFWRIFHGYELYHRRNALVPRDASW